MQYYRCFVSINIEFFRYYITSMIKIDNLTNRLGMSVALSSYGASIVDIFLTLPSGEKRSVTIHPRNMNEFNVSTGYYGKTIGRNAGRIANGRFQINNDYYQVLDNTNHHGLHGGTHGLAFKDFTPALIKNANGQGIVYSFLSTHLLDGFPGNLDIKVSYFLYENENRLSVVYEVISDHDTICNLTNHTYFNLDGKGTILNHTLQIPAHQYLVVNKDIMPVRLEQVTSIMDFSKAKSIGKDILAHELLETAGGYDHPYILDGKSAIHRAAILASSTDDIALRVSTSYPVLVFYSGNYPTDEIMNTGKRLAKYEALALEPQYLPDAINNAYGQTKTGLLKAGQRYHETIDYEFITK